MLERRAVKSIASKRLRAARKAVRPLSEEDMDFLFIRTLDDRDRARRERAATRTRMDVTLSISYPNPKPGGNTHPSIWNWQYMASKAFPDAEVEVKSWTKPTPDWS